MPDAGRGIVATYDIQARTIIDIQARTIIDVSPVLVMSFEELDAIKSLHIVGMAFTSWRSLFFEAEHKLATDLYSSKAIARQ